MHILLTGNVNVDVLMGKLDDWPQKGTETILHNYDLRIGGALGNMALALHALEARVSYYANVGDDTFGQWLADELRQSRCELASTSVATAVTVGVSHPDGQRTFFSTLGHLNDFDLLPLETAIDQAQPGDLLFICGYFLIPPLRKHARALLQKAQQRQLITAMDTGWPSEGWTLNVRNEVQALLEYCSFFLPNELELQAFTGLENIADALTELGGAVKGQTIVKLGPDGAAYLKDGKLHLLPAPSVSVIDTIGAGDSFNAGFIAALQRGLDLNTAIQVAIQLASSAISTSPRTYCTWKHLQ